MIDASDAPARSDAPAANWPSVPLRDGKTVTVGRSPDCDVVMPHQSISRLHAALTRNANALRVEDRDSSFGVRVNGHPIKVAVMSPDDVVQFGASPLYRFDGAALRFDHDASGMTIRLSGIGIVRNRQVLLKNVNAEIASGEFVGVLGPSGGGKSLLLGCLSDTLTPTEGAISFDDGKELAKNRAYYRSKLGFVPQEDLIFENLTVEENLRFAADLRLPPEKETEKDARVAGALEAVDMLGHRHKRAGHLSGGQKKRVSVAIELLTRPRLLLLDEPTSGLDPGTQFRLMDTLRKLSRRGLTVVCVTHSMDSLHFFDSLLVLGFREKISTIVYHDAPDKLLAHFGVHTLPDLFDVLQGGVPVKAGEPSRARTRNPQAPAARIRRSAGVPDEPGRLKPQILTVMKRTALCAWRDRGGTVITFGLPVLLAFLIVFTQYKQRDSLFASFFLAVSALWLGMTLSVREVVKERKLYIRDRLAGLLPSAFLAGKTAYFAAAALAQTILLYGTTKILLWMYLAMEYASKPGFKGSYPVTGLGVLFLVGFGGVLLGLIVSTVSNTEQMAVGTLPLLLLPQVLLSRVATMAELPWDDIESPFLMLSRLSQALSSFGDSFFGSFRDALLFLFSFPLFTRSGTAALDLFSKSASRRSEWFGDAVFETLFLVLLAAAALVAFIVVFMRLEKNWTIR